MLGFGWVAALALPLLLAILISKTPPWPLGLAALWIVGEFIIQSHAHPWALYGWWAAGAIGLAAWGVRDGRSERVNMASAMFAGTVLTFYFSQVMDKLGRSASLIGLGILFLAGGWAVEQTRRRLIRTSRGEQS
jgi:hypothetical protein